MDDLYLLTQSGWHVVNYKAAVNVGLHSLEVTAAKYRACVFARVSASASW